MSDPAESNVARARDQIEGRFFWLDGLKMHSRLRIGNPNNEMHHESFMAVQYCRILRVYDNVSDLAPPEIIRVMRMLYTNMVYEHSGMGITR